MSKVVDQAELVRLYRKALSDGVPLDKLDKKVQKLFVRTKVAEEMEEKNDIAQTSRLKSRRLPKFLRFGAAVVPIAFLSVGLYLVGTAVMPIVGYYLKNLPNLRSNQLASPIPKEEVLDVTPLIVAQVQAVDFEGTDDEYGEKTGPVIIDAKLDYTNLANWFENSELHDLAPDPATLVPISESAVEEEVSEYIIDIPKLNIANARVAVGGTNLNKSLIQYPGTALPGKAGSPVVFGHSVLRSFYNPKQNNPRRYNSIFSTIMTLKKGDKIYVKQNNVRYTYMVQDKSEVKPTDTYILSQRYDVRQLKLVTCTPEGTYLRRGVVTAQLVKE